eukprot:Awhi_evm1s2282
MNLTSIIFVVIFMCIALVDHGEAKRCTRIKTFHSGRHAGSRHACRRGCEDDARCNKITYFSRSGTCVYKSCKSKNRVTPTVSSTGDSGSFTFTVLATSTSNSVTSSAVVLSTSSTSSNNAVSTTPSVITTSRAIPSVIATLSSDSTSAIVSTSSSSASSSMVSASVTPSIYLAIAAASTTISASTDTMSAVSTSTSINVTSTSASASASTSAMFGQCKVIRTFRSNSRRSRSAASCARGCERNSRCEEILYNQGRGVCKYLQCEN